MLFLHLFAFSLDRRRGHGHFGSVLACGDRICGKSHPGLQ